MHGLVPLNKNVRLITGRNGLLRRAQRGQWFTYRGPESSLRRIMTNDSTRGKNRNKKQNAREMEKGRKNNIVEPLSHSPLIDELVNFIVLFIE